MDSSHDKDDTVSLRDLDEPTWKAIGTLRDLLKEKYGSIMESWLKCLDKNATMRVEESGRLQRG